MEKVKLVEIANEVGTSNKTVFDKAIKLSISVKSVRSSVTVDDAERIFNAIFDKVNSKESPHITTSSHKIKNIYFSLTSDSIDNSIINDVYKYLDDDTVKSMLLFSYAQKDTSLKENLKTFYNDFDFGNISDQDPLVNLQFHIKRYKPEMIFIDAIDFQHINQNLDSILAVTANMFCNDILFYFSVVNISLENQKNFISKINKSLKNKQGN